MITLTTLIDQIKQTPVRKKRFRKKPSPGSPWSRGTSVNPEDTGIFRDIPEGKDRESPGDSFFPRSGKFNLEFPRFLFFSEGASRGGENRRDKRSFGFALLLLAFLLAGSCLFLNLSWPGESSLLSPREDTLFQANMASYAGLLPAAEADESGRIPLDLTETFAWSPYRVKKGDSVSKIAAAYSLSMDAVIASNGITNAKRLAEGQTIRLPNMDGIPYTIKAGDSLAKISAAMGVPLEVILDANDVQSDFIAPGTVLFIPGAKMRKEDLKLALGELFIYPVRGRLTSPFGWRNDPISGVRRYHAALDLAAPLGTPIKAAMDGRVSLVGVNSTYGKYVILSHTGGYQTLYAHMSLVSVKEGGRVNQGSKIGEVGNTGYSTGPHLHFAVFKNGRAVNPLDLLNS
jgi:murein DD-endopeptidase MepM/ murein hydrolase activator NlpD